MVFFKGLSFILINLIGGYLIAFLIKAIIFLPRKAKYFRGKQIKFTPGLLYRKRDWIMDKINTEVKNFLRDAKSDTPDSRIHKWEENIFKKAWEKFNFIEKKKIIPKFIKEKIHFFLSSLIYEISRQFLRNFVPYLMDYYHLSKYIDLIDKKFDVDMIYDFFNRKIYKYVLYFFLGISLLIGTGNMIFYFIIH